MNRAGSQIGEDQTAVETEAGVERSEMFVGLAGEPASPKIHRIEDRGSRIEDRGSRIAIYDLQSSILDPRLISPSDHIILDQLDGQIGFGLLHSFGGEEDRFAHIV